MVVGTKAGELLVYDLATSSLIQTIKAHAGTVWSVHVKPNKLGMATGSADKEVKFWDFEYNVGSNADQVENVQLDHKAFILTYVPMYRKSQLSASFCKRP